MSCLHCPECRASLSVDPERAPSQVICPGCSRLVRPTRFEEPPRPQIGTLPRFEPEPYEPDGGLSVAQVPLLLGILAAAAVALGALASIIGHWFYLVLIFPAAVGAGVGAAGAFGSRLARMRNASVGGLMGLLAGGLAVTSMHWFDYQRFLGKVAAEPAMRAWGVPPPKISFGDFLELSARAGVRISDMNLGYTGTWIYWVVEALVIAGIAFAMIRAATRDPFCTGCNNWKKPRVLGAVPDSEDAIEALRTGNLTHLAEQTALVPGGTLVLNALVCPVCGPSSTLVVKLQRVTKDAEQNMAVQDVLVLTYPGEALSPLEDVFRVMATAPPQE